MPDKANVGTGALERQPEKHCMIAPTPHERHCEWGRQRDDARRSRQRCGRKGRRKVHTGGEKDGQWRSGRVSQREAPDATAGRKLPYCRHACQQTFSIWTNGVRPKTLSHSGSPRNVLQSWHGVGCWKRTGSQKQRKAKHQRQRPKFAQTHYRGCRRQTALMVNWCTCTYNNANSFLKLSTTICMSMRPWAETNPDDAHLCDFCLLCAQQPVLTNHSRREPKFDSFGSPPCAWLS